MAKSKAPQPSSPDEDDYRSDSDADTLQRHAEITSDPDRHQKAAAKLQQRKQSVDVAHRHAQRAMRRKVKANMAKVFTKPDSDGDHDGD